MALWIAPDDVLPRAIRVIAEWGSGSASVCLVRDTRGRIRVALGRPAGGSPHPPDGRKLAEQLADQLGSWFAGPIVDGSGSPAHKRIAEEIFSRKLSWPLEWPKSYENLAGASVAVPAWLVGMAVVNGKESWLVGGLSPSSTTPHIVSFYSFKGGVGRTTTLACVAARLSDRGKRVLAIDLDLEAPGLGNLLGARSDVGVLDHVLSHVATGTVGSVQPESVSGFENLWVVSAGSLKTGYLEKLARLDFLAGSAGSDKSPTEDALRCLIAEASNAVRAQVVLLDSRAGLHDVGGLALHRLSHLDVLVARANEQSRQGLRVVLDAIRRLRPVEERDVRIVQTMVKLPFESADSRPGVEKWRREMYDLALETIYADLPSDKPSLEDETAHYPLLVPERDEFTRADRLSQLSPTALEDFDAIADIAAPPEMEGAD